MRNSLFKPLQDRRVVFCINSGRAGSKYLANLLNTSTDVKALHEPKPKMNEEFLRMINEQPLENTFQQRLLKKSAIKKQLFGHHKVYCETSHMFIKTFYDVVLSEFKNVEVILLNRNIPKVLHSFVRLGYFSERNKNWPNWMSSPNATTAVQQVLDEDLDMDQIGLCIAYLLDIEARKELFVNNNPQLKYHHVDIDELNRKQKVEDLFQSMSIRFTKKTAQLLGEKINNKANVTVDADITGDVLPIRLSEHLQRLDSKNISYPDSFKQYS